MEVRVLGTVEVFNNGAPARLGGPKQRTVLALLAAELGRVVSTDRLIDSLWGESAPSRARHTLQTYISNLRTELGDVVVREGAGYRLDLDRDRIDAAKFEDEVDAAKDLIGEHPMEASSRLRQALALWRGNPYSDQTGVAALDIEARRLEELRLTAVEDRIQAELALGMHSYLVAELEGLTAEFPLRERFRAQHMLALYRSGRQAEALRSYDKTRRFLGEELGIEPSVELRDLEQRILEQDPALDLPAEVRVDTLAFLLTDVDDVASLWALYPETAATALAHHDRIVVDAIQDAGGTVFKSTGSGVYAAFAEVAQALDAAQQAQLGLTTSDWGASHPLKVRMAIDLGEVESRGGDYSGPPVNRGSRLVSAAHGGQVLLSADAHAALSEGATPGWQARALGDYHFKGLGRVQAVFQLVMPDLPAEFPALVVDRASVVPPVIDLGRSIRGYELRERVGSGDFGVVYRAYQPSVGREVALKAIRPELVNQPAFVRLFEIEAQLVASLEHPHIVALYDFWRDPEGAYLVMRWMRAGSLRRALERGPWNLEPALLILRQISSALSYAHRQGVIHRDLKPSNVLLDEDENAYLADFGIAHRLAETSSLPRPRSSSPAYLPPEEMRGEPLRVTSDIYGLGLLAFEILAGTRLPMDGPLPSISDLRPEIPEAVGEVIATATAVDPGSRFPSVDEFISTLVDAAGHPMAPPAVGFTPSRNPYKGLHAFDERDAADFFGRDSAVAELLQAVGEHRLVAVVGPSGIGKSSLVRAGLIPALRSGALPGSQDWLVTDLFPGSYPFEELESALLRVAVERPSSLIDDLHRDERGLTRLSKQILPPDAQLLLVIDQFEELFTLTADEETRRSFMAALAALVSDQRSRVRFVITLRADFFDRPLRYPEFGDLLRGGMVAVTAPSEEELALAVERPAAGVGVAFEPGLVSRIIADVQEQPGALPLLQYALTELFASRTSDLMTVPGYLASGGVLGALGTRAEEIFSGLDPAAKEAARQVFLRLVTVGDAGEDTRRRVQKRELRGLGIDQARLNQVLEIFGKYRLLTFDRDPHTRGPTVEVAHEALLSEWPRLREWITERREDLLLHRRLAEAVSEWESSGRSSEFLMQRGRLHQFESWATSTDLLLSEGERGFLAASRVEEDVRRRRLTRRRWAIVAVLAVAVILIAGLALNARQRARVATARELAAASVSVVDEDAQLAILLALEAMEATAQPQREAIEALHQSLQANRQLAAAPWPAGRASATQMAVAHSPDGSRLAVSADGAQIDIWDQATKTLLSTIGEPVEGDIELAWPMIDWHGDRLAALGPDGVLRLWNPESDEEVGRVQADPGYTVLTAPNPGNVSPDEVLSAVQAFGLRGTQVDLTDDGSIRAQAYGLDASIQDDLVKAVAGVVGVGAEEVSISTVGLGPGTTEFSPDGARLATVHQVGSPVEVNPTQLRVWDTETLELVWEQPYDGIIHVAFNGDGSFLAVARFATSLTEGLVEVRDGATGDLLNSFTTDSWVGSITVGLDGNLIVGRWDNKVSFHDWRTGEEIAPPLETDEPAAVVAHSPVGSLLAVNHEIWDLETRRRLLNVGGDGQLGRLRFSDDGERVATGTTDLIGRVWALPPDPGPGEIFALSPAPVVGSLDINRDGTLMAILTFEQPYPAVGAVELRTVTDLSLVATIPSRSGLDVALAPDGSVIAAFGEDGLGIWRTDGTPSFPVLPKSEDIIGTEGGSGVAFSRDGSLLAGIGSTGLAGIWEVETGTLVGGLWRASTTQGFDVFFSPDGSLIATTSNDSDAKIWRVSDLSLVETVELEGFGGDVFFTPDQGSLVILHQHGTSVIDLGSGERIDLDTGFSIFGALSPDGTMLAIGAGNVIDLWDLDAMQLSHSLIGHTRDVVDIWFQPDGLRLVTAAGDSVRAWTLDTDELVQIAHQRLTRRLTDPECQTYLHLETCPSG